MPKIIENIRQNLLEEARRQVLQEGYSALTVRSVAAACGISVGTVYNYFPSKDMLIASFMLEDWQLCLDKIEKVNPMIITKTSCIRVFSNINTGVLLIDCDIPISLSILV